jgi:hypothetical protein
MKLLLSFYMLILLLLARVADGFQISATEQTRHTLAPRRPLSTCVNAKSRGGMGMANNNNKKKPAAAASLDLKASLLRHGKKYDELLLLSNKRLDRDKDDLAGDNDDSTSTYKEDDDDEEIITTTEFIITCRHPSVSDWVPIAQLVIAQSADCHDLAQQCLSLYCRELAALASKATSLFQHRTALVYALEPMDSFHKHVYKMVVESTKDDEGMMSKARAMEVLQLQEGEDGSSLNLAHVKKQYRTLSAANHPDRGDDNNGDEYALIQEAFTTLTASGALRRDGSSWYESLGGRARTDFRPVSLIALEEAKRSVEASSVHKGSAVCAIDRDMVETFVARSRVNVNTIAQPESNLLKSPARVEAEAMGR